MNPKSLIQWFSGGVTKRKSHTINKPMSIPFYCRENMLISLFLHVLLAEALTTVFSQTIFSRIYIKIEFTDFRKQRWSPLRREGRFSLRVKIIMSPSKAQVRQVTLLPIINIQVPSSGFVSCEENPLCMHHSSICSPPTPETRQINTNMNHAAHCGMTNKVHYL